MDVRQRTLICRLLEEIKATYFIPEYQASDEEAMGLLLSQFFEWDGLAILRTAKWALEDANFHRESAKVAELVEALEWDEDGA